MIISRDAKKSLTNSNIHFLLKKESQLCRNRRHFFNLIKSIYENFIAKIKLYLTLKGMNDFAVIMGMMGMVR